MQTLKRGDHTPDVTTLQQKLTTLGSKFSSMGNFGPETEAAVRDFQSKHGLAVTGVVDDNVWQNIDTALNAGTTPLTPDPVVVKLPVEYFSQRDNVYEPTGTCNVTCLAMVLHYYGVQPKVAGQQLEDELFQVIQGPEAMAVFTKNWPDLAKQGINPRNVHDMLAWTARKYGFKAKFSLTETYDSMKANLQRGVPLIVTGSFTGSGHIVCLVGFTQSGDWIVNDPWGDWNQGYHNAKDGSYRIYSHDAMMDVLKVSGHDTKWCHIIEKQ